MSGANEPEWKIHAVIGVTLILDALFLGIAPKGPWADPSFSRGIIGLAGMTLAYVAWYRATFRRTGLIPWLDLWHDPKKTARIEMAVAMIFLFAAWVAGNPLQHHLPDPTGLVLTLVGLLIALQSAYVMLSTGPLSED